jgi:heme a synthase
MMEDRSQLSQSSPWPHRLAVALALVTFPLIWVGGLVTTYDAGMAVPDWPGTYGYNLFRYPWQTWIAGPWDLFIEHGHRLLGATAGIVSIALVIVVWLTDRHPWLFRASLGALALVIVQGALGGARVLFDERQLALIHGCVGPLFFAYLAGLVVATSQWWQAAPQVNSNFGGRLAILAWIIVSLATVQLVIGAVLRHIPLAATPSLFRAALLLHLVVAGFLLAQACLAAIRAWPLQPLASGLRKRALVVCALLVFQIALGALAYVAKYAFPAWLSDFPFAAGYVVHEKSLAQSLLTTAHVATGSLILFAAVVQAMCASRFFFGTSSSAGRLPAYMPGWKPTPEGSFAA